MKATKEEKKNLANSMRNMIQEDISSATINAMKEQHNIEINQEMLTKMME